MSRGHCQSKAGDGPAGAVQLMRRVGRDYRGGGGGGVTALRGHGIRIRTINLISTCMPYIGLAI